VRGFAQASSENVEDTDALGAWRRLMYAYGRDLPTACAAVNTLGAHLSRRR